MVVEGGIKNYFWTIRLLVEPSTKAQFHCICHALIYLSFCNQVKACIFLHNKMWALIWPIDYSNPGLVQSSILICCMELFVNVSLFQYRIFVLNDKTFDDIRFHLSINHSFNCRWIEKHRAKSTLPYSRWSYVKCTWLRLRAASGAPCRWLGTLPEALPLLLCNCHPGAGLCHLLSHPVPLRARILPLHHSARWVSIEVCSVL